MTHKKYKWKPKFRTGEKVTHTSHGNAVILKPLMNEMYFIDLEQPDYRDFMNKKQTLAFEEHLRKRSHTWHKENNH